MGVGGCRWVWVVADGCGWLEMGVGGCRWAWLAADGCVWLQMGVGGCRVEASIIGPWVDM